MNLLLGWDQKLFLSSFDRNCAFLCIPLIIDFLFYFIDFGHSCCYVLGNFVKGCISNYNSMNQIPEECTSFFGPSVVSDENFTVSGKNGDSDKSN